MLSPISLRKHQEIRLHVGLLITPRMLVIVMSIGSFAALLSAVRSSGAMQLVSTTSGHMAYEVVAASAAIAFFFILAVAIVCNALLVHGPVAAAKRNGKKTITSLLSTTGTTGSYNKYTRVVRSLSPRTLTKRLQSQSSGASVCIPHVSSHSAELSLPTTVKNPFGAQGKVDGWKKVACQWIAWDPNPSTRAVVNGWLTAGDEKMATR